ncbi:glycosyltransferase [Kocuria palustris]|jgi:glycosyltransferase involved in cell wall biosynthesis|uniref:glycosyltransferase n=4 Tax=Kocuria palustris TaxID=71999 RepID=UPI0006AA56B0|nr:glycosyltransferase [Kocuria palustris]MBN6758281.1 glycosyltransferase [Kocuria palustris]MBN6763309.1 glycosyltransferase [Kocuria palustris]MBN6783293.1 glycosyltransferase [Kocuria palustris]MBN6798846.1 glycosyltransferase [Kocuria palustris]MBZ6375804.1 glycosyltransferase [Kocuria palustris]
MTGRSDAPRTDPRLRHLSLVVRTAWEHLGGDPAVFALQVSRRLPAGLTARAGRALCRIPLPSAAALGLSLVGEQEALGEAFDRALLDESCAPAALRRLAEVAIAADRPDDAFRLTAAIPRRGGPSGGALPTGSAVRGLAGTLARRDTQLGALGAALVPLQRAWLRGEATRGERAQLLRLADERAQLHGRSPSLPPLREPYQPQPRTVVHVLTNSLPHTASGYAVRSHALLSAQAAAGWQVHAQTRPGYPAQVGRLSAKDLEVIDGVSYHRISPARLPRTASGRLQLQAEALLELCLWVRPAVLHTTTHFVNALVVREVAAVLGIPWVYEVRGQLADTWASRRPPVAGVSERYTCFQAREAEVMEAADDVATLGAAMARRVEEVTGGRVDAASVRLSPNAVGPQHAAELEPVEQARADVDAVSLGIRPGQFLMGTVSSIVDYEGLDDLVRAMVLLPEPITAVIVGDGAARPALEALARDLGVADRVVFPGRVDRDGARSWQRALDVFVVPRLDREVTRSVTPLKLAEASARGVPVIASRLPALEELVEDGVTGLLVPPEDPASVADAVRRLWGEAGTGPRLGRAGRAAVLRERTWEAVAARTLERYDELTARGPTGQAGQDETMQTARTTEAR